MTTDDDPFAAPVYGAVECPAKPWTGWQIFIVCVLCFLIGVLGTVAVMSR